MHEDAHKQDISEIQRSILIYQNQMFKFYLKDGSWFALRPSGKNQNKNLFIFLQSIKDAVEKQIKLKTYLRKFSESRALVQNFYSTEIII